MNIIRKTFTYGSSKITLETGRIARQATGAVFASMDDTQVLATVVANKEAQPEQSFFPLSVNYIEKTYAAGKLPGGFLKREARPSEKEILTSRLIDRPIRPLFPDGFMNDVQIIIKTLSVNKDVDPDILAMISASAALVVSGIPFDGPIGVARVGYEKGAYVLNPTYSQLKTSQLDMVVAGTKEAVLMVESEAEELSEQVMLDAVIFAHEQYQSLIDNINEFAHTGGKEKWQWQRPPANVELQTELTDKFSAQLEKVYQMNDKIERYAQINELKEQVCSELVNDTTTVNEISNAFKSLQKEIVRRRVLNNEPRIDGRDHQSVRPLTIETGVLANTHGSALFTRGETQALVVTTLGSKRDAQLVEKLEFTDRQEDHFLLHYNFPPYCVGETGLVGAPKRREIGHGRLARRSLAACMPAIEDYPFTIRVVSEITESNGSSSMASVCGSSLSLMDAGVPLKAAVAGIAMGLVKEADKFVVLTDILGDEDHLGDMDFKVAGTQDGITALQMDIKITSITPEIMKIALAQAKEGRNHILGEMAKAISNNRDTVSANAPRIFSMSINKDKIRDVIGTGGKVIREICETTGAKIDIDDDGNIKVASADEESANQAIKWIEGIVAEPERGKIYHGKVVKIMDFGAFVNFLGNRDGLVHISELAEGRTNQVSDVVGEGQMVYVKCLGADDRGKVRLSMRVVDQESGESLSDDEEDEREHRSPRRELRGPRKRD